MLTVACVLKSGGIYDARWVYRLKAQVARHLSSEHKFVCLADRVLDCWHICLRNNWPGWWSKLELFNLPGPVLYFDLDTAVVGDLSDMAAIARERRLVTLRDFYREKGVGSGVMAWSGPLQEIHAAFAARSAEWQAHYGTRGDQAFLEDHAGPVEHWQTLLPGQVVSYKAHVRKSQSARETGTGEIPQGARVVCLHGQPKFEDMAESDPVRLAWEAA